MRRCLVPAASVAVWMLGCGPEVVSPHLLTEARALAIRVEVVETGPYSGGLLPIPVDRTRMHSLPLDTIEAHVLIADSSGVRDPADFDPRWFFCRSGICLRNLQRGSPAPPCSDGELEGTCELERAVVPRLRIPPLRPDLPLRAQAFASLGFIAGVPGERTTDDCLAELQGSVVESLQGCVLAWTSGLAGPAGAFVRAADAFGVDIEGLVPEGFQDALLFEQPNFNPELPQISIDQYELGVGTIQTFIGKPGRVTVLPPNTMFQITEAGDPRDEQEYYALPDPDEVPRAFREQLYVEVFGTDPDRIGYLGDFTTGPAGGRFELLVGLTDGRGGVAWDVFPIEVGE